MPLSCLFFNCGTKQQLSIPTPVELSASRTMSLQLLVEQCKVVFGIRIPDDPFETFFSLGFHTIYGITKDSNTEGQVKVRQLEALNKFLAAETVVEKKNIFLTDCKAYIAQFLADTQCNKIYMDAFTPIIAYANQQFCLITHSSFYEKRRKGESKEAFTDRLKKIGEGVSQLLLLAMGIEKLIKSDHSEPLTTDQLRTLLKKFQVDTAASTVPSKLPHNTALEPKHLNLDEAVANAKSLLEQLSQHVYRV